jgi:SAM-dependent methyltransferase
MEVPVQKQYGKEGASTYSQQCEDADYATNFALPTLHKVWNLPRNSSLKLLDIGCGTGIMTRSLKQVSGGVVLGVDIAAPMVQAALAFEATAKQGIQYCEGDCIKDMQKLPAVAALAPFDLVNASWLWTNASNYAELKGMATNAYNLLRQGGQLCGLLDNPFLSRKDYPMFERYHIFYTPEGTEDKLKDGQILGVSAILNPRLPPLELSDHFWTAPTIEKAVREAGFNNFKFIPPPYIYKTENPHEATFYKPLIDKPNFLIFTATK